MTDCTYNFAMSSAHRIISRVDDQAVFRLRALAMTNCGALMFIRRRGRALIFEVLKALQRAAFGFDGRLHAVLAAACPAAGNHFDGYGPALRELFQHGVHKRRRIACPNGRKQDQAVIRRQIRAKRPNRPSFSAQSGKTPDRIGLDLAGAPDFLYFFCFHGAGGPLGGERLRPRLCVPGVRIINDQRFHPDSPSV